MKPPHSLLCIQASFIGASAFGDSQNSLMVHILASAPKSPGKVRLYPVSGHPRLFSGYHRATEAGEFGIVFEGDEMTAFKVRPASSEWQDPTPNFGLLQELAEDTGGSFLRLRDIDSLPDLIPEASRTEVIGETATRVWDSTALMLLFCGLLVSEWVLRKLWHLN